MEEPKRKQFSLNGIVPVPVTTTVEPFLDKLRSLIRAVEAGSTIRIRDSPISQIAEISGEIIYQLADLLKGNASWGLLPNPGLKFVEKFEVPSDIEEECFFDPVGTYKVSEGRKQYSKSQRYYQNAADPLGNPLQVEISFEDPSKSIKPKDRHELADLLIDFSQLLFAMQEGRIDWHFMRQVRSIFHPTSPSKNTKINDVQKAAIDMATPEYQFVLHQQLMEFKREKKREKQRRYRNRRAAKRASKESNDPFVPDGVNTPPTT